VKQTLSQEVRGRVFLEWRHPEPATRTGSPEEVSRALEAAHASLEADVVDLLAIIGGE
jgi:hypothetical protein